MEPEDSGGIRNGFTECGERLVESRREQLNQSGVDVLHFSDRAGKETGWVNDDQ